MRIPDKPGQYTLTHIKSEFFYVGSTRNLRKRLYQHKSDLIRGVHTNQKLQKVFRSWDDFEIEFVITTTVDAARDLEQTLLDTCIQHLLCCNVASDARGIFKAGELPEEHLTRLTEANRGRKGLGRTLGTKLENPRSAEANAKQRDTMTKLFGKRLEIDGVVYDSIQDAARTLGVERTVVMYRAKSTNHRWRRWTYL